MYPKTKQDAAMLSETIREILGNEELLETIMSKSDKKPIYWDSLPKKTGAAAIVVAQLLKAMGGDTNAFSALSRYGFGEKVQMSVSDFYRTNKLEIEVVNPEQIGDDAVDTVNKILSSGDVDDPISEAEIVESPEDGKKSK